MSADAVSPAERQSTLLDAANDVKLQASNGAVSVTSATDTTITATDAAPSPAASTAARAASRLR